MCEFEDSNGKCHATACFTNQRCGARKDDGRPNYCDMEICRDGRHKQKNKIKDFGEDDE